MTASDAAALVRTVDAEAATVEDFVALLEREQEMLVKGQVDDLIELVRQKDAVAAKLATLAAQRSMLLRASGLTTVSYTHLDVYKRQVLKSQQNLPNAPRRAFGFYLKMRI